MNDLAFADRDFANKALSICGFHWETQRYYVVLLDLEGHVRSCGRLGGAVDLQLSPYGQRMGKAASCEVSGHSSGPETEELTTP